MKIVLLNQFQSEQSREWIFRQTMCGVGHMNCTGHMSFMETWLYGPCGLHGTLWLYGIHRLVDTPELNILIASDKCEVWEQMWCMGHMWFLWHMWCMEPCDVGDTFDVWDTCDVWDTSNIWIWRMTYETTCLLGCNCIKKEFGYLVFFCILCDIYYQ